MNAKNVKVLIIDDVFKNLQVLGFILERENIKTIFAENGERGIKSAIKNPPDLILLDISMPQMDGFEVCEILKKNKTTKNIPIIFLTARSEDEDIKKGFKLGAVDYVTKPFNTSELLMRINTHVNLKRSRELIEKQNKELKELNQTKDRLFSIIGHDLRGPIGNMKMLLEMLSENPEYQNSEMGELITVAKNAAGTTYTLLENLLNWARFQRDEIKFNPKNLSFVHIVNETIMLYQTTAENKKITIKRIDNKNLTVWADDNMVRTIMRNFLSNAIKFTPAGGEISISAKILNDKHIFVSISDTGVGISDENKQKILAQKFFTTYGTEQEKGSGLGLNLCIGFIKKHKGNFTIDSEVNKGTTFSFTLPRYNIFEKEEINQ